MSRCWVLAAALLALGSEANAAFPPQPTRTPLLRAVDLDIGESQWVELSDGTSVQIKLLALDERRDPIRDAVRAARVKVEVNNEVVELTAAMYRLPTAVGRT